MIYGVGIGTGYSPKLLFGWFFKGENDPSRFFLFMCSK